MRIEPYLNFDGRCEEAIEFYRKNLSATAIQMMRFKDCPVPMDPNMIAPGNENKIMHASFRIGETTVNAADGRCTNQVLFKGVSLSLWVESTAEADRVFNALALGGKINMPLDKTFFSPRFGMVNDKFGVQWMVITAQSAPKS